MTKVMGNFLVGNKLRPFITALRAEQAAEIAFERQLGEKNKK